MGRGQGASIKWGKVELSATDTDIDTLVSKLDNLLTKFGYPEAEEPEEAPQKEEGSNDPLADMMSGSGSEPEEELPEVNEPTEEDIKEALAEQNVEKSESTPEQEQDLSPWEKALKARQDAKL